MPLKADCLKHGDKDAVSMQLSEQRCLIRITGDFLAYGQNHLQILPSDPPKTLIPGDRCLAPPLNQNLN